MTNSEHLLWIRDRLVHQYGESENVDFVLRLAKIANDYDRLALVEEAALSIFSDLQVLDEIQDSTLARLRAALDGKGAPK